jgi:hypothetical protein
VVLPFLEAVVFLVAFVFDDAFLAMVTLLVA